MVRAIGGAMLALWAIPALAAGHVRMPDGEVMLANYPPESLARGEQGAVGIRIRLNKAGRLMTCAVSRSSGYAALDAATCSLLIANARMKPFRDAGGRIIDKESDGQVVWTLPPNRVPDMPPPMSSPVMLANAADPVVCREQLKRGSLVIRQRICLTEHEWRAQIGYAQGELHGMTSQGGGQIF